MNIILKLIKDTLEKYLIYWELFILSWMISNKYFLTNEKFIKIEKNSKNKNLQLNF